MHIVLTEAALSSATDIRTPNHKSWLRPMQLRIALQTHYLKNHMIYFQA